MSVYLDYNATAPIDPRVLSTMIDVYQNHIGNADSRTHNHGEQARGIVEKARSQVASLLGVDPTEVFFTSGATESNNIALQGLKLFAEETKKKHIITSSIEHKAVLETAKALSSQGYEVDFLDPDRNGRISAEKVCSSIKDNTLIVSLMHVNNETGIIQPVDDVGDYLMNKGPLFHVDATQSCGKLVEEIRGLKYDMLSFSAHKLMGPQGIGCLVLRKKDYKRPPVRSIMFGGQQENGIRPGTVPVALVAGCGEACALAEKEYKNRNEKTKRIKNILFELLAQSGLDYRINGSQEWCVSNTVNLCFPGVSSEAVMLLSREYCSISNGSACTSRSYSPSYVLLAMGLSIDQIESSIRVSWGADTDERQFCAEFSSLLAVVKEIGQ